MNPAPSDADETPETLRTAEQAAAEIASGIWELDAEPEFLDFEEAPEPVATPAPPVKRGDPPATLLFPNKLVEPTKPPPTPEQIIEAMLFAGGTALTAEKACSAIRGLSVEQFRQLVEQIGQRYRQQKRPYIVQPQEDGYVLVLKAQYRQWKEKFSAGPKETRLTQAGIETLSLVAYRQPITKGEIDAIRGSDSNTAIRQLVRLSLIRSSRHAGETTYQTAPRFLEVFGLGSLEDLPQLQEFQF